MLKRLIVMTIAVVVSLAVFGTGAGLASVTPSPGWRIDSLAEPTNASPEDNVRCLGHLNSANELCDGYRVTATNAGSASTDGSPVVVTDTLPVGVTVRAMEFYWSGSGVAGRKEGTSLAAADCTVPSERVVRCTWEGKAAPDEFLQLFIFVTVKEGTLPGPVTNVAEVSGGGGVSVHTDQGSGIGSTPASFGGSMDFFVDGLNGARDTQAGDHPYELTTTIDFHNEIRELLQGDFEPTSVEDVKDIVVDLPLGFVGSTLSAPECTLAQLASDEKVPQNPAVGGCPPDTIIGHLETEPVTTPTRIDSPLFNLVPEHGYPAEFGYLDFVRGVHVLYAQVVPTSEGYVLRTIAPDIPQIPFTQVTATFYGDPAVRDGSGNAQIPFFTNPTDCSGGPQVASLHLDSWQNPGSYNADGSPNFNDPKWFGTESVSPAVTGCNAVQQFTPELKAQPTTNLADSPSGLEFELKVPQSEETGVLATPPLKNAVVKLPEGMTVDPSAADGLDVCSEAQIGWTGPTLFDFTPAQPECPESSKIGSLELETPLIPRRLEGEMYLAAQNTNPFGSTLAAYVVVDDPVTGVLIKLAGEFKADPVTGQITATFSENPQLPFSDLKLHFFGGPRAELTTPEGCGLYTTSGEMTPWSFPDSGPIGLSLDAYLIDEGCVDGFSPAFSGGSTNLQAGAYTSFVASFARSDTDQELAGLTVSLPPGLLANVGSVPECSETQIHETEQDGVEKCPPSSQVGTVRAGAGPGPNPLFVPGKVFFTGPYNGGPYGLAVVVPADPGPFNFGLVVVRQSLRIDPQDAHVTDVSDPFPTILDPVGANGQTNGIPIRLRRVDVEINRPGFTFNPTNCGKLQVGGSITSRNGASSRLAVPFQITNCSTLGFKPQFKVSTSGHTSRVQGASLDVKLSYPAGSLGKEANIAKVKVDLPKQLPSRLTTLQKACPDQTFDVNPAACPAGSRVGIASASTPILPYALTGPAYFVSHGGAKFPELVIVLSANGITVDLYGETFISKAGITSSTFRTIPDVPVQAFELNLPEGPGSALAANGNLCTAKLKMPTAFTAQNGAVIKQSTPIAVTGCPKRVTHKAKKNRKGKI